MRDHRASSAASALWKRLDPNAARRLSGRVRNLGGTPWRHRPSRIPDPPSHLVGQDVATAARRDVAERSADIGAVDLGLEALEMKKIAS